MGVCDRFRMGLTGLVVSLTTVTPVFADTLADALASSYRNSNLLEQNRALLRAADEDVQQAIGTLRPVVEFVTQFVANSDNAPTMQLSMGVQASMTLVDFGRGEMSVEVARETVMATRAALVSLEQSVLFTAAQAYLSLYSELQTVQLQRNNVTVITEQLRAARERFELGDSTRTDVAIADARLAAARSALAAAQGSAAIAREAYNLAIGRYPSGLSEPPSLPRLPATLEEAQDLARRYHPSITQAQHQVRAAELGVEIAQAARMGAVTGSLTAEGRIRSIEPLPSTVRGDITASLRYGVQLYNGGQTDSRVRQAIARVEAQRANLHQTVAIVQQSVAANWSQLLVARARLDASTLQINASQSAYEGVRAEAELGSRTTLDVLNAEQELFDARSARVQAFAAVQTAAYALLNSMGRLTVDSLGLGIPTYDVEAYVRGLESPSNDAAPSAQGQRLDRILSRFRRPSGE